ncbi:MAG: LysR family transcriptional regulator [Acetivibrio sp.]
MDINFELYKVFYYVAKTLSFSEASKELFISQSAVSQSIKVLEKRLGQTLFIRSTKRVQLSKEGDLLFKHIEPAIHLINQGEAQLLESNSLHGGQLRIGASDTICRYFLVPYLKQFHQKYPGVHIKVMNGTSGKCVDLLESNQVDLIVTNSPNKKLSSIGNILEIKEFHDVFLASREFFPELEQQVLTYEELQDYPILMLEAHATTSEFLHQLFLQHQLELAPSVELSSNDLLIDLARIGLGITFVPDFCLDKSKDDLMVLKIKEPLPKRKLVVACSDSLPLWRVAEEFIAMLLETPMD